MKHWIKFIAFATLILSITACDDGKSFTVVDSHGGTNVLVFLGSNEQWEGAIGDAVRRNLARPVDGLPREEPLFSITQLAPEGFKDFKKKSRTILRPVIKDTIAYGVERNVYGRPQTIVNVYGTSEAEIAGNLETHADAIIDIIRDTELRERTRRLEKSLSNPRMIREELGITLKLPSYYRVGKKEDNFFWILHDIKRGDLNILLYEIPLSEIQKDSTALSQIIATRDRVGQAKIPVDEGGKFITEAMYAPYLNEVQIDGRFAYETKGIWEVKNKWMAGPFINYMIEDQKNNRWLVAEGFLNAPSMDHREFMFEMEAILRSIAFE